MLNRMNLPAASCGYPKNLSFPDLIGESINLIDHPVKPDDDRHI
jgi:hypothetical protein